MIPTILLSLTLAAPPGALQFDALDQVNAQRAARGLPPFARDHGLALGAQAAAAHRASARMFGHTANDFAFLPPGARASAAGCAAYPAHYGFMACCTYDRAIYAGAASVPGPDGRVYHHLFVSDAPSSVRADALVAASTVLVAPIQTQTAYTYRERTVSRGVLRRPTVIVERVPAPAAPPAIPQPKTAPVEIGGCANGRCETGRTVVRERLFFRGR